MLVLLLLCSTEGARFADIEFGVWVQGLGLRGARFRGEGLGYSVYGAFLKI